MGDPDLRVSDREREATVEKLREHSAEGRLDADELEERLTAAYAARTRGELEGLTRDLPEPAPAPPRPEPVMRRLTPFVARVAILNAFLVAVWLISGGPGTSFWPVWVMLVSFVAILNRATHELGRGGASAARTSPRARDRERRRRRARRR